jgi:DNA-binding GntR family transcriptional regulator
MDDMDGAKLEAIETELLAFKKKEASEVLFAETTKPGIRLHDLILQATGNDKLFQIGKNIREHIRSLSFNAVKKSPGRTMETVEEHLRIIQTLKKRDKPAAKHALAEHSANMYRALTQIIG